MNASLARVLAAAVIASGAAFAQSDDVPKDDVAKRVEEIAKKPEIYHQTCMQMDRDTSLAIVVSVGGAVSHSQHAVSAKQFAELREKRDGAVKALVAWLEKATPAGEKGERGVKPERFRIAMLVDLNASEALPALKKYAEACRKEWEAAGDETEVDWEKVRKMDDEKRAAIYRKVELGDRLGDALSAIVAILRQEKFEGAVKSKFEKDAEAEVAKVLKEPWATELADEVKKNGGKVAEKDREGVIVDPVLGAAVPAYAYPKMKVTAETITTILGWVDEFAKLPAEKRLGAKGMAEWPVAR